METLNVIAAWLRDHWAALVSVVAVVAVITVIALLPPPYRKATLAILAVVFIALCAVLIWRGWNNDRSENYGALLAFFVGVVLGIIGIVSAVWAWIIW